MSPTHLQTAELAHAALNAALTGKNSERCVILAEIAFRKRCAELGLK